MQDNIFQPNLGQSAAYTYIDKPIQNDTTAKAVGLAAKVGIEAAKKIAVHDLTGGTTTPDEAAGQAPSADELNISAMPTSDVNRAMAMESIDNLAKLSRARKSGMGLDAAQDRARALYSRAVNANPLFAGEIRDAYKNYFGGGGTGSGIFDATPEEKATLQFREDVQMLSNELQIPSQDAADRIRLQREQEIRLKDIEATAAERNLNGDEFVGFTQVSLRQGGEVLKADIAAQIVKTGPLTPEQKQVYLNQVQQLASQTQARSTELMRDGSGKLQLGAVDREGLAAAQAQVDNFVKNYTMYINDNDLQTIVNANKEITNSKYRTALLESFGPLIAIREVVGNDASAYALQEMMNNKSFTQIAKDQPFLAGVFSSLGDFNNAYGTSLGQSMQAMIGKSDNRFGSQQKDVEVAGIVAALSSSNGAKNFDLFVTDGDKASSLSLFKETFTKVPEAVTTLTRPDYRAMVRANPSKYTAELQASADGALKGLSTRALLDSEGMKPDLKMSFTVPNPALPDVQVTLKGDGASEVVKERFREVSNLLETYPTIWETDFESPYHFMADYFGHTGPIPEVTSKEARVERALNYGPAPKPNTRY